MVNCPEIDCPYAYELYHKKGVVFRVKTGGRVETRKGRFWVAEDSRGMRIDFEVEGLDGHSTPRQLPLSQETVESIKPATKLVSDQYGDAVSFVIARILWSPSEPGYDQRAA